MPNLTLHEIEELIEEEEEGAKEDRKKRNKVRGKQLKKFPLKDDSDKT